MKGAVFRPDKRIAPASKQAVSSQAALVFDSDEVRTLTEIGFLAAGAGRLEQAQSIFDALRRLRPQRAFPLIGLAMALMNAKRSIQAVQLLESVQLSDAGEQIQLDTWRGFALQQSGHHYAGRKILTAVLNQTRAGKPSANPQLAALADALLNRSKPDMAIPSTAGVPAADHGEHQ